MSDISERALSCGVLGGRSFSLVVNSVWEIVFLCFVF